MQTHNTSYFYQQQETMLITTLKKQAQIIHVVPWSTEQEMHDAMQRTRVKELAEKDSWLRL